MAGTTVKATREYVVSKLNADGTRAGFEVYRYRRNIGTEGEYEWLRAAPAGARLEITMREAAP